MVDFQELGEHFPSDSSVLIFASTTRVGTWFGHAMSPYTSTCHFLVVPRVVFLFVDVSFFLFCHVSLSGSDTWCQHGKFLFSHVSPPGSNMSHILIGPRVLSTCRVCFIRVRFLLDHVLVSYWTMHPFLILVNVRSGPPRVQNLDVKPVL